LYAYNTAEFVEQAIQSLLGQDYPNVEVVLSDDGSTDGTWEIMRRIASEYTGPHRLLLNHNEHNIGIGSQINAAVAMTQGRLIVLANADDISHSNRVARSVDAWLDDGQPAAGVWSSMRQIGEDGEPLGRVMACEWDWPSLTHAVRERIGGAHAASLALDRRVFECFGPLPQNLMLEDNPLFARAIILGTVKRIAEPLVDYRVHSTNISQAYAGAELDEWRIRNQQRVVWQKSEGVKAYIEILRDLHQWPADRVEMGDLAHARWIGMEKLLENVILRDYYAGDTKVGGGVKLGSLWRLALLVAKTKIKCWLPYIERRNLHWHYRQVVGRHDEDKD